MSNEWRPISEAPRDGRLVLLWIPHPDGGCVIAPSVESVEAGAWEKAKIYHLNGEWPDVRWNPTHWMPLPTPPTEASDGK